MPSPDAGQGQSRAGATNEAGNRTDRRGARPRILLEMQNRLDVYLDDPGRHLPTLNAANGSDRQQRSGRRVACVQLLLALLSYLDLLSLRVGIPQRDSGFMSVTLPFLASHACL
jgi:hypothetical protein